MTSINTDHSKMLARYIRAQSLQMVHSAKASHIGSALSVSDILAVLYSGTLNVMPSNPQYRDRDRFILSKGHACVAVYAALAARGFISEDELGTFGRANSRLMCHVSHKVPGVEFSTGSLGHGLPFGVGKSFAARRLGQSWRTVVLMSDGELGEGSNWEAMLFASHHKLDNLIAIVDYNKLQSLTSVEETLAIEPLADKALAFGWHVREVDGHDHAALSDDLVNFPWSAGKPSFLIAHTTKGRGVSFMEDSVLWHYKSPTSEELARALEELKHA